MRVHESVFASWVGGGREEVVVVVVVGGYFASTLLLYPLALLSTDLPPVLLLNIVLL